MKAFAAGVEDILQFDGIHVRSHCRYRDICRSGRGEIGRDRGTEGCRNTNAAIAPGEGRRLGKVQGIQTDIIRRSAAGGKQRKKQEQAKQEQDTALHLRYHSIFI